MGLAGRRAAGVVYLPDHRRERRRSRERRGTAARVLPRRPALRRCALSLRGGPMLGSYIRRGAVAGLAGGAASALFLLLVGERTIGDAIRLEEKHGGGGQELYTRGTQVFGGALGVILVSIALGVLFAVTFAAVRHRLPG